MHAARRIHEMENVKAILEGEGLSPNMTDATLDKLRWMEERGFKRCFPDGVPDDWKAVAKRWQPVI